MGWRGGRGGEARKAEGQEWGCRMGLLVTTPPRQYGRAPTGVPSQPPPPHELPLSVSRCGCNLHLDEIQLCACENKQSKCMSLQNPVTILANFASPHRKPDKNTRRSWDHRRSSIFPLGLYPPSSLPLLIALPAPAWRASSCVLPRRPT
jgi:hypothetical protein